MHPLRRYTRFFVCVWLLTLGTALARSPERETICFSVNTNVGFGNSVYVTGGHKDLGEWQPTNAIKLRFTPGNIWSGQVAVQAGTTLEYKFLVRNDSIHTHCDTNNGRYFPDGANLATNLPSQPDAPYAGKSVYYYSGWTNALLLYSSRGGPFTDTPMSMVSTGRNENEFIYELHGVGEAGESIEFVMHGYSNNVEYYDNVPGSGFGEFGNNYFTTLDAFVLRDSNLFTYGPPPVVSPSRIETNFVVSSEQPNVISRAVKVYLPRGYDENTGRAYPVLYMHDGEESFTPGVGLSGAGWEADKVADQEISQGRMRETIIVGVPNSPSRSIEYLPPEDLRPNGTPGFADQYARFLINDVKAGWVDATYRTLPDFDNTATLGSSYGGQVTAYLGFGTNVFSKIGPMSPAYLTCTNFVNHRIDADPKKPIRIYTDMGEAGITDPDDLFPAYSRVYDLFLEDGYVVNRDLKAVIGCGHDHNEQAWHQRLPFAFRFLLDIRDEPNLLLQQVQPPEVVAVGREGATLSQTVTSLRAFAYRLDRAASITNNTWSAVATSAVETLPWSSMRLESAAMPGNDQAIYRVVAEPRP